MPEENETSGTRTRTLLPTCEYARGKAQALATNMAIAPATQVDEHFPLGIVQFIVGRRSTSAGVPYVFVVVAGHFDGFQGTGLGGGSQEIEGILLRCTKQDTPYVLLDMAKTTMFSDLAIVMVRRAMREAERRGGCLLIAEPDAFVAVGIAMLGSSMFRSFPTVEEAERVFDEHAGKSQRQC